MGIFSILLVLVLVSTTFANQPPAKRPNLGPGSNPTPQLPTIQRNRTQSQGRSSTSSGRQSLSQQHSSNSLQSTTRVSQQQTPQNTRVTFLNNVTSGHSSVSSSDNQRSTNSQASLTSSGNTSSQSNTGPARVPGKACKILINEIYTGEGNGSMEYDFIELRRVCPSGTRPPRTINLDGNFVFVVSISAQPKLILASDLRDKRLGINIVDSLNNDSSNAQDLFIIGSNVGGSNTQRFGPNLSNRPKLQYNKFPQEKQILPKESPIPVLVAIVYVPYEKRTTFWNLFVFPRKQGNTEMTHLPLTSNLINEFAVDFSDYVVYGRAPNNDTEQFVRRFTRNENLNVASDFMSISQSGNVAQSPLSYSRCDDKAKSIAGFMYLSPSPFRPNPCPKNEKPTYTMKRGQIYNSVSQKLILNVVNNIANSEGKSSTFQGRPERIAANLLGVSKEYIRSLKTRAKTCGIRTPKGNRVAHFRPVRSQIDLFDKERTKSFIADSYRAGLPPFVSEVYRKFMAYKTDGCVTLPSNSTVPNNTRVPFCGRSIANDISPAIAYACPDEDILPSTVQTTNSSATQFKCSKSTFSRVLRELGFEYGTVDKRAVIELRSDISIMRGKFIKAIRDNEARPEAERFKITWMDETWIDPHNKFNHNWRLKNPATARERLRYSYRHVKIGSGPRLIVFVAGDDDGLIKESIKVRHIQKGAALADYHGNVDAKEFKAWFNELLATLKARDPNKKHFLIMDNASYHSTMIAPTTRSRKADQIAWLEKVRQEIPELAHKIPPPPLQQLRLFEIWDIVSQLKQDPMVRGLLYEVDQAASKEGHRVVRLPPYGCRYNPIELVWSQIKRNTAIQNVYQNLTHVEQLARANLMNYNTTIWKNQLRHVKGLRDKAWEEDHIFEQSITPIVIPINTNDDSDEDSDENDFLHEACFSSDSSDDDDESGPSREELAQNLQDGRDEFNAWFRQLSPPPQYRLGPRPRRLFDSDNIHD